VVYELEGVNATKDEVDISATGAFLKRTVILVSGVLYAVQLCVPRWFLELAKHLVKRAANHSLRKIALHLAEVGCQRWN
jgi:hypothetical protein